jgi:hypothetical protein
MEVFFSTYLKYFGNLQAAHISHFAKLVINYASVRVCNILVLTLSFKLINFTFQVFPHFVPELSTSFASYMIRINWACLF